MVAQKEVCCEFFSGEVVRRFVAKKTRFVVVCIAVKKVSGQPKQNGVEFDR